MVNDEIDMVLARVAELAEIPDVVHLAHEVDRTHQGDPKPYYLTEYCEAHGMPPRLIVLSSRGRSDPDPWVVEYDQRDGLLGYAESLLHPDDDDLILSCDADEIVRASALPQIAAEATAGRCTLGMRHHWYDTCWHDPAGWYKASAFLWRDRPDSLSHARLDPVRTVQGVGWHLSWFGGVGRVQSKLRSFSHAEYNTAEVHDRIPQLVAEGISIPGLKLSRWDALADFPPGFAVPTTEAELAQAIATLGSYHRLGHLDLSVDFDPDHCPFCAKLRDSLEDEITDADEASTNQDSAS